MGRETRHQLQALIPDDVRNWCTPEPKLAFGKAYQPAMKLFAGCEIVPNGGRWRPATGWAPENQRPWRNSDDAICRGSPKRAPIQDRQLARHVLTKGEPQGIDRLRIYSSKGSRLTRRIPDSDSGSPSLLL